MCQFRYGELLHKNCPTYRNLVSIIELSTIDHVGVNEYPNNAFTQRACHLHYLAQLCNLPHGSCATRIERKLR